MFHRAVSDNRRGAGHDKFISYFVQLIKRQKAIEQGHTEVQFKATGYWVEKYFVAEIVHNPCSPEQKTYMKKVFDRFEELVRSHKRAFENDGLHKRAAISPIEFIAVAYLIDLYGATRINAELEEAIRNMRRKVRAVHDDEVRRKPKVWDTLIESIRETLDLIKPQEKTSIPEPIGQSGQPDSTFPTISGGTKRPLVDNTKGQGTLRDQLLNQLREEAIHHDTPIPPNNQGTKRPSANNAKVEGTLHQQLLNQLYESIPSKEPGHLNISSPTNIRGTKRPHPETNIIEDEKNNILRRRFIAQRHEAAIEEERYRG